MQNRLYQSDLNNGGNNEKIKVVNEKPTFPILTEPVLGFLTVAKLWGSLIIM